MAKVRTVFGINTPSLTIGSITFRNGIFVTTDAAEKKFLTGLSEDPSLGMTSRDLAEDEELPANPVLDRSSTIRTGVLTFQAQFAGGLADVQQAAVGSLEDQIAAAAESKAASAVKIPAK